MIRSFQHKGLKRLFEDDDARGVNAEHVQKLKDILDALDTASTLADMDLPGFKLHALKGADRGVWAMTVRANWRVAFRFVDPDASDVNLLDYH